MRLQYAGIGSRSTPHDVLSHMTRLGREYALAGYTLRSGGAGGADTAFESGCDSAKGLKEIYVPWAGFNGRYSSQPGIHVGVSEEAIELAAKFHPNWRSCTNGAKKLHARNCYQILGRDLKTPVERVVCWTPNGSGSGGTGQAIRIARAYGILVIDLGEEL